MDKNEVETKIISYFQTVLNSDAEITDQSDLNEDLHVTSFQLMSILACVEADCGVELTLTDARNCKTIGDFVDAIAGKMG